MVLVLLLIFLVPISLYCLVLAGINRSGRPMIVSGMADFIGLLFALSGFLFVVGPQILRGLIENAMDSVPLDIDTKTFDKSLASIGLMWKILWRMYYVIVVVVIGVLFWWREKKTVIYNIELSTFETEFTHALARLGLAGSRSGSGYVLTEVPRTDASEFAGIRPTAAPTMLRHLAELRFEYFPALCHLTLHWQMNREQTRERVEAELARCFRQVEVEENPASAWFLGVGGGCIAVIFVLIVLLMVIQMLS